MNWSNTTYNLSAAPETLEHLNNALISLTSHGQDQPLRYLLTELGATGEELENLEDCRGFIHGFRISGKRSSLQLNCSTSGGPARGFMNQLGKLFDGLDCQFTIIGHEEKLFLSNNPKTAGKFVVSFDDTDTVCDKDEMFDRILAATGLPAENYRKARKIAEKYTEENEDGHFLSVNVIEKDKISGTRKRKSPCQTRKRKTRKQ